MRTLARPSCGACGQTGSVFHENLQDQLFGVPQSWSLRECRACDLLWLDPLPINPAELYASYYTHEENAWGLEKTSLKAKILAASFGYAQSIPLGSWSKKGFQVLGALRALKDYAGGAAMWLDFRPNAKLLDVGSGSGEFIARMQSLGWTAKGREYDESAVAFSRRRYSIDVSQGGLPAPEIPSASFDAVTLSHVIEHVAEPEAYFLEAKRILVVGGRLVMITPNRHSLLHRFYGMDWRGLEPPRHFHIFSQKSVRALAQRTGFRIIEVRTSSRTARQILKASELIRGKRRNSSPRKWILALAIPFQVFEALGDSLFGWGEEVLLIAEKTQ